MTAIIVDDEPLARDCVRVALRQEPGVEVVAECEEGEGAVAAIRAHAPDLVFLDVQMPGLDGFGVVERIGPDRMPAVVFVTAYDAHALRAFQVHAVDYVLKPFDDARLSTAVARVRERLLARDDRDLVRRLSAMLRDWRAVRQPGGEEEEPLPQPAAAPAERLTRFAVREDDRIRFVRAEDVDWIESAGNYVRLHVGERRHRVRGTMGAVLERLDPRRFVRIHRSAAVNLDRVREVQPWFGGDYVAILHSGRQLRVSRTYAPALVRPLP